MIRCTLELLPGGYEEDPQHLGTIYIANEITQSVATGGKRGEYIYSLEKKRKGRTVSEGMISDYPRLSYSVWELVRRILNQEHWKGKL
jgi:hypothetical protein